MYIKKSTVQHLPCIAGQGQIDSNAGSLKTAASFNSGNMLDSNNVLTKKQNTMVENSF